MSDREGVAVLLCVINAMLAVSCFDGPMLSRKLLLQDLSD